MADIEPVNNEDYKTGEYRLNPNDIEEFEKLGKKVAAKQNNNNNNKKKKQEQQQEQPKKEFFYQRYTSRDNLIAEAVIVGGKPKFAMAIPKVGRPNEASISLVDQIDIGDNIVIKPYEVLSYINRPYTFDSKEKFEEVVESTKTKNLDIIYRKVKSIWTKYIDADDFHISLCAADTIFTYFQDKIGLTHYLNGPFKQ
jgi:hypothetical protein